MGASDSDRRQSARGPIRLRVDYERMNAFFADYTKNISKGGTFIKTERPLPHGTRFVFALAVPALADPVQLTGEVQWSRDGSGGEEAGMGIRFVFESDEQKVAFEQLVEGMMEESLGRDVTRELLRLTPARR